MFMFCLHLLYVQCTISTPLIKLLPKSLTQIIHIIYGQAVYYIGSESNYQGKLDKVESILESLKKQHAGAYSEERLRAWVHPIEMEKHSSYDEPPNTPFFCRKGLKGC